MARILSVFLSKVHRTSRGMCSLLPFSSSSGGSHFKVQFFFAPISTRTCCPRNHWTSMELAYAGRKGYCSSKCYTTHCNNTLCKNWNGRKRQILHMLIQFPSFCLCLRRLHFQLTYATYSVLGACNLVKEPFCQKASSVQFFPYQVVKLWDVTSCILFSMTAMKPFQPPMQIKCDLNVIPNQKHSQQLQRLRSHLIRCKTNTSPSYIYEYLITIISITIISHEIITCISSFLSQT